MDKRRRGDREGRQERRWGGGGGGGKGEAKPVAKFPVTVPSATPSQAQTSQPSTGGKDALTQSKVRTTESKPSTVTLSAPVEMSATFTVRVAEGNIAN